MKTTLISYFFRIRPKKKKTCVFTNIFEKNMVVGQQMFNKMFYYLFTKQVKQSIIIYIFSFLSNNVKSLEWQLEHLFCPLAMSNHFHINRQKKYLLNQNCR